MGRPSRQLSHSRRAASPPQSRRDAGRTGDTRPSTRELRSTPGAAANFRPRQQHQTTLRLTDRSTGRGRYGWKMQVLRRNDQRRGGLFEEPKQRTCRSRTRQVRLLRSQDERRGLLLQESEQGTCRRWRCPEVPLLWGKDQCRWFLFQESKWRSRDRWRHPITNTWASVAPRRQIVPPARRLRPILTYGPVKLRIRSIVLGDG